MSKFMQIAGIVAVAAGVAVVLMAFFSPGQMQIYGLTAETGSILLMGGLLMIGVSGLNTAIESSTRATLELRDWFAGHEAPMQGEYEPPHEPAVAPVAAATAGAAAAQYFAEEEPDEMEEFRAQADEAIAEAKAMADEVVEVTRVSTTETLASLDQAKEELSAALDLQTGPVIEGERAEEREAAVEAEPEPEPVPEPEPELADEESGEGDEQLYVVEEKLIRGRPARVLSDGTVEAETEEGWMRFENLEHLEEYLDAMSPVKA